MEKSFRENNREADFALLLQVGSIKVPELSFLCNSKEGSFNKYIYLEEEKRRARGEENKLKTKIVFHMKRCRSWSSLSSSLVPTTLPSTQLLS